MYFFSLLTVVVISNMFFLLIYSVLHQLRGIDDIADLPQGITIRPFRVEL